jgi:hypothetical protein
MSIYAVAAVVLSSAIAPKVLAQNQYVAFTRTSDSIKVNGNTILNQGDFTYEMRVWLDGDFGVVIKEQQDRVEDKAVWLGAGQYQMSVVASAATGDFRGSLPELQTRRWMHVVWMRSGAIVTMHINGVPTFVTTTFAPYLDGSFSRMSIGRHRNAVSYLADGPSFIGRIDWIRISRGARYQTSVTEPSESSLVSDANTQLLLKFNEPAGSATLIDESPNHFVCQVGVAHDTSYSVTSPTLGLTDCAAPVATTQPTSPITCEGVSVSLTAAFSGTSPSLQWRKDGVNIAGATGGTLNLASPAVADAGVYECVASNACGIAVSQAATLTVLTASTISVQPQPQTLVSGGDVATLALTASGSGLTFQWRRNGTPLASGGRISGATTSSLTITSVAAADQGTYDCLVTGSCGSVVSNPATLTVSTCPVGWTGTTTAPFGTRNVHAQAYAAVNGGTLLFGGTTPANTALGDTWLLRAGTWSQVASTGPAARAYVAMATLPNGRVLLFGGQTVVNSVASSQGDTWEWNGTAWNRLNVPGPSARAGHSMALDTVRNRVVLFGGLDASGVSRQDTWEWNGSAWTQVATSGPPGNFGQASAFDPVRGETIIFGGAGSGSSQTWAWNGTSWRQAATTGIVARNYPAMAFDESLGRILLFGGFEGGANVRGDSYLWTGSAWTPSGIGSPPSPRWKHGLSFDRTANAMVITAGTGYGQVPLYDWNVLAAGPQPTSQPRDASIEPGGTAQFTFGVSGGSVAYRWHRNGTPLFDGGSISGAAYPTLVIAPMGSANQGVYHCVATGPCGTITSRNATLACAPVISQQPAGGTYVGGQPVTLTVVASAGTGATYRWRKDGVNIFNGITYAGVTSPSLTITADEPSQSGDYSVAITNACGTTVSDIAWVEVTCPADFNSDGGTDGQDLFEFFEAWSGGESNADLNFDGGIDGGDVTAFYLRWENGC